MARQDLLNGWIRLNRTNLFGAEPINGKKPRFTISYNQRQVGISLMCSDANGALDRISTSINILVWRTYIEGLLDLIKTNPTEKTNQSLTIRGLASSPDPSNKELVYGFNPEKGFWVCLRKEGVDPVVIPLLLPDWHAIKLSDGTLQPQASASGLFAKSWAITVRESLSALDAAYISHFGDDGDGGVPGGGAGGAGAGAPPLADPRPPASTGAEKDDDMPF